MNWKEDRIGSALSGENPTVLLHMNSGFAVMADTQFLPGYCILLGCPKAGSLNELTMEARQSFLADMSLVGDAIMEVCTPLRINYEILGNLDTYLHAHIIPRYDWEDDEFRKGPVWLYPPEIRNDPEYQFDPRKNAEVKFRLAQKLKELTKAQDQG